jgi:hypothetical protein
MKILNLIGVSSIFLLFIFRESEHQNIGAATLENIHRCVASEYFIRPNGFENGCRALW